MSSPGSVLRRGLVDLYAVLPVMTARVGIGTPGGIIPAIDDPGKRHVSACELIWSGKMIDADEALALGIVSQLTDPEDLMSVTYALARSFAAGPATVIRLAKRAMYRGMETSLREALEFETYAQNICSETADAKEGIRAFVEKREPKFTGR